MRAPVLKEKTEAQASWQLFASGNMNLHCKPVRTERGRDGGGEGRLCLTNVILREEQGQTEKNRVPEPQEGVPYPVMTAL